VVNDPTVEEGVILLLVNKIERAFDENQEICIDNTSAPKFHRYLLGRNVIFNDMPEWGDIQLTVDPNTGALIYSPEGLQQFTMQSKNKVDIISTIDGFEVSITDFDFSCRLKIISDAYFVIF